MKAFTMILMLLSFFVFAQPGAPKKGPSDRMPTSPMGKAYPLNDVLDELVINYAGPFLDVAPVQEDLDEVTYQAIIAFLNAKKTIVGLPLDAIIFRNTEGMAFDTLPGTFVGLAHFYLTLRREGQHPETIIITVNRDTNAFTHNGRFLTNAHLVIQNRDYTRLYVHTTNTIHEIPAAAPVTNHTENRYDSHGDRYGGAGGFGGGGHGMFDGHGSIM